MNLIQRNFYLYDLYV